MGKPYTLGVRRTLGLDNIPAIYPCIQHNSAVKDNQDRIDCVATKEAGGCPWDEELGKQPGAVYGMLGVSCWYRGKSGNWMLDEMRQAGYEPPTDFFGSSDDVMGLDPEEEGDEGLNPEECLLLATWMEDHAEAYSKVAVRDVGDDPEELRQAVMRWRYAAMWLRWISQYGGSRIWY